MYSKEQQKKFTPEQLKRVKIITWISAILMALTFVFIANMVHLQNKSLLKDGIQQEVIVISKRKGGTRKQPTFHMKVAWFTEGEKVPYYEPKDTTGMTKDEKFSDEFLSKFFKDKHRTKLGDYQSFDLKFINGDSYNKLKIGDVTTLVYLEGQPEDGRLLREIDKKNKSKKDTL